MQIGHWAMLPSKRLAILMTQPPHDVDTYRHHSSTMLKGVRVLDLSRLLPGPAATWFLQGMGALVDRVEGKNGDLTRFLPPIVDGVGSYFSAISKGKALHSV